MSKMKKKEKLQLLWLAVPIAMLLIGLGVWWYISTNDARKANAEFQQLVDFANQQQVEIAIIKQAAELRQLKIEHNAAQQKRQAEQAAANQELQNKLSSKQE